MPVPAFLAAAIRASVAAQIGAQLAPQIRQGVARAYLDAITYLRTGDEAALARWQAGGTGRASVGLPILGLGANWDVELAHRGGDWAEIFKAFGEPHEGESPEAYAERITRARS